MPRKGNSKMNQDNASSKGTILNFLKKVSKKENEVAECIDLVDDGNYEDIIESTPVKSRTPEVLRNVPNVSPPHSTQKVEDPYEVEYKKRKFWRTPSDEDIPELDFNLPRRKKPYSVKNGIKVVSLSEISQNEFETYQADLAKGLQTKSSSSSANMKTPEKQISPSKNVTPRGKNRTTVKLFNQSPKKGKEFKVEILQPFVKITPSKSEKHEVEWRVDQAVPIKSAEKKQQSIVQYAQP